MDIRLERWLWYSYFQSCAYIIPILCDMLVSKVLFHWLLAVRNRGKRQFSKQKLQEKNPPHLCVSGGTKHLFQKIWHACFLVAIVFRFAPLIYYRWNFSVINSTTWTAISTTPALELSTIYSREKKRFFLNLLPVERLCTCVTFRLIENFPEFIRKMFWISLGFCKENIVFINSSSTPSNLKKSWITKFFLSN